MDKFVDRVKDGSTSIGTGDFTTAGSPPTGYQSFTAVGPVGSSFPYVIENTNQWEAGTGIITAINGQSVTFSRQPTASSSAGNLVDFSIGTKTLFLSPTAASIERFVSSDATTTNSVVDPHTSNLFIEEDGVAKRVSFTSMLTSVGVPTEVIPQTPSDWNQTDVNALDFIKNKPTIPDAPVQADWDETDSTALDFIKNKPVIPTQEPADWAQTDSSAVDFIKNKPTIPTVPDQVQADWDETDVSAVDFIKNKPTIPAAQIQADWAEVDTAASDFIKNKPIIPDPQVQVDWDQSNAGAVDFIKNKPIIPVVTPQVQADWDEVDSAAVDFIKNKPVIPAAQIQADWTEANPAAVDFIKNKPTIPVQVQADWNETNTGSIDFIKNKPTVPAASILACWPGPVTVQTGTVRNYPRADITVSSITAWLSAAATADVTAQVRVSGVVVAIVTIPAGSSMVIPTITPFTVVHTAYLTADVVSGSGSDLTLRLDY